MHIVVVSGYYYPFMIPPVRCINPFVESLSKENELEVVCPVYDNQNKESALIGNTRVHFVDCFSNHVKLQIRAGKTNGKYKILNSIVSWAYRASRFLLSLIRINAYEDPQLVPALMKQVEKINDTNHIDTLISVSFPFYTHLAAKEYKQKHNDVRWISFTTDPYAYNEANPVTSCKMKKAIAIEKAVYDNCDCCVVTEELFSNLVNDYKINISKIIKLPYLLTPYPIVDKTTKDNGVNILYAGYVYDKIRNPKLMMETFRYIPNVKFNLYISGDRFCRKYLSGQFPSNYYINGLVPRDKYLELLSRNDVLVNLSNTILLQAPSKLLELISTGKPVVNFYHHEDTGFSIIEKYPLGINIPSSQNIEGIVKELNSFIEKNAKKRLPYETICSLFKEHLFENQLPLIKAVVTK